MSQRRAYHHQHRTTLLFALLLSFFALLSFYTVCSVAESAKTYTTSCQSGFGNNIDTLAEMVAQCGATATPACPLTAAESTAATDTISAPLLGSDSYFGGTQTHSTTPNMIIWTWNQSPQHGVIFWVQPNKGTGVGGGYAPGGSYQNWGAGAVPPSTTGRYLSSSNSLLGGRGPWSTQALGDTNCVTCQKESCVDACTTSRTTSIVGTWWPSCTCTCKSGYVGKACNRQVEVFPVPNAVTTIAGVFAICEGKGGYVAQPKNRLEEDTILQVVPAAVAGDTDFRLNVIIGAYGRTAAHTYCYHEGPRIGQCVAIDGSVVAGQYSAFGAGVLTSPQTNPLLTALLPLYHQNNRWTTVDPTSAGKQVACEFTTCDQACQASGTVSSAGNYPNCVCSCKKTHAGRWCQRLKTATFTLTVTMIVTVSEPIPISNTLTQKVSTSNSVPMTSSQAVSTSQSVPMTPSLAETATHIKTGSNSITSTHTLPLTLSAAITESQSIQSTTTATNTIGTLTLSKTAPMTNSVSLVSTMSSSLPHTLSLQPTTTDSKKMTLSITKTRSLSSTILALITTSTSLSAPTPSTSIASTVSKLELSHTSSLPPTHSKTYARAQSPTLSHTVSNSSPQSSSSSLEKTHTTDNTRSTSIPPTASSVITASTSRSAASPSITPTPTPLTSATESIPAAPTVATASRTRSIPLSRACPSVLASVFRTANVTGTASDLTPLSKDTVSEQDLQLGLLVLNLTILEANTTLARSTAPPTSFAFHSDVSMRNITLINQRGVPLNVTPSCILASPTVLLCLVPELVSYKVLEDGLLEIRASGNEISPPCTDYPWSVDWLRTVTPSPTRSGSSAATARSIAIAGLLLFDGTPIEIQVMTAMLNSVCASDLDRDSVLFVRYLLSPFVHLGSYWVVIGNITLSVTFALLHAAVLILIYAYRLLRTSTEITQKTGESRQPVSPELRREIKADAASCVMFPGITLLVCHVLYIGVACATFDMLRTLDGANLAVSAVGFSFLLAIPVIDIFLLSKVIYVVYQDFEEDLGCQPRGRFLGWLYPRGVWGPRADVKRYFGLVGPYRGGYRLLAASPLALALLAAILFYAVSDFVTCRYTFAATTVILVAIAVLKTLLLPRRARILSILTGICMLAVAGISALNFFIDMLNMTVNSAEVVLVKQILFVVAVGTAVTRTIISIIIFVGEIIWYRRRNEGHDPVATNGYLLDEKCRVTISRPSGNITPSSVGGNSDVDAVVNSIPTSQTYQKSTKPDSGDNNGLHTSQLNESHEDPKSSPYSSQEEVNSKDNDGRSQWKQSIGTSVLFTSIQDDDELYNLDDLTEIINVSSKNFSAGTKPPTPPTAVTKNSSSAFSKICHGTQNENSVRSLRRRQYETLTNRVQLQNGDDAGEKKSNGLAGVGDAPCRRTASFANSQFTYCREAMRLVPKNRRKSVSQGGAFGVPIGESYMEGSGGAFGSSHLSHYFEAGGTANNINTKSRHRRQTISFAVDPDGLWVKRENNAKNTTAADFSTKEDWSYNTFRSGGDDNDDSYFYGAGGGRGRGTDKMGGGTHFVPTIINNIDMVPPCDQSDDFAPYAGALDGNVRGVRKDASPSSSASGGILRLMNRPDLILSSNRPPAAAVLSEMLLSSQRGGRRGDTAGGDEANLHNNMNNECPCARPREFSNASTTSSVISCTSTIITPLSVRRSDENNSLQEKVEEDATSKFLSDFASKKF